MLKNIIPMVGLGTYQSTNATVGSAIKQAIVSFGYRHIDCASDYLNEDAIGDALANVISTSSSLKRKDLFITGKLNQPYHRQEHVMPHLKKTLLDLRLSYLDLWLMHWPIATKYVSYRHDQRGFDKNYDPWDTKIDNDVSVSETWKAMEECQKVGLVKSIGVSNFSVSLLHDLLSYAEIKPICNQVEMHPYLQQPELLSYCKKRNIQVVGYSPLGSGESIDENNTTLLNDALIVQLAKKYKATPAQICLKWNIMRGVGVIPKSVTISHLEENCSKKLDELVLEDEDMEAIKQLNRNYRFFRPETWELTQDFAMFH